MNRYNDLSTTDNGETTLGSTDEEEVSFSFELANSGQRTAVGSSHTSPELKTGIRQHGSARCPITFDSDSDDTQDFDKPTFKPATKRNYLLKKLNISKSSATGSKSNSPTKTLKNKRMSRLREDITSPSSHGSGSESSEFISLKGIASRRRSSNDQPNKQRSRSSSNDSSDLELTGVELSQSSQSMDVQYKRRDSEDSIRKPSLFSQDTIAIANNSSQGHKGSSVMPVLSKYSLQNTPQLSISGSSKSSNSESTLSIPKDISCYNINSESGVPKKLDSRDSTIIYSIENKISREQPKTNKKPSASSLKSDSTIIYDVDDFEIGESPGVNNKDNAPGLKEGFLRNHSRPPDLSQYEPNMGQIKCITISNRPPSLSFYEKQDKANQPLSSQNPPLNPTEFSTTLHQNNAEECNINAHVKDSIEVSDSSLEEYGYVETDSSNMYKRHRGISDEMSEVNSSQRGSKSVSPVDELINQTRPTSKDVISVDDNVFYETQTFDDDNERNSDLIPVLSKFSVTNIPAVTYDAFSESKCDSKRVPTMPKDLSCYRSSVTTAASNNKIFESDVTVIPESDSDQDIENVLLGPKTGRNFLGGKPERECGAKTNNSQVGAFSRDSQVKFRKKLKPIIYDSESTVEEFTSGLSDLDGELTKKIDSKHSIKPPETVIEQFKSPAGLRVTRSESQNSDVTKNLQKPIKSIEYESDGNVSIEELMSPSLLDEPTNWDLIDSQVTDDKGVFESNAVMAQVTVDNSGAHKIVQNVAPAPSSGTSDSATQSSDIFEKQTQWQIGPNKITGMVFTSSGKLNMDLADNTCLRSLDVNKKADDSCPRSQDVNKKADDTCSRSPDDSAKLIDDLVLSGEFDDPVLEGSQTQECTSIPDSQTIPYDYNSQQFSPATKITDNPIENLNQPHIALKTSDDLKSDSQVRSKVHKSEKQNLCSARDNSDISQIKTESPETSTPQQSSQPPTKPLLDVSQNTLKSVSSFDMLFPSKCKMLEIKEEDDDVDITDTFGSDDIIFQEGAYKPNKQLNIEQSFLKRNEANRPADASNIKRETDTGIHIKQEPVDVCIKQEPDETSFTVVDDVVWVSDDEADDFFENLTQRFESTPVFSSHDAAVVLSDNESGKESDENLFDSDIDFEFSQLDIDLARLQSEQAGSSDEEEHLDGGAIQRAEIPCETIGHIPGITPTKPTDRSEHNKASSKLNLFQDDDQTVPYTTSASELDALEPKSTEKSIVSNASDRVQVTTDGNKEHINVENIPKGKAISPQTNMTSPITIENSPRSDLVAGRENDAQNKIPDRFTVDIGTTHEAFRDKRSSAQNDQESPISGQPSTSGISKEVPDIREVPEYEEAMDVSGLDDIPDDDLERYLSEKYCAPSPEEGKYSHHAALNKSGFDGKVDKRLLASDDNSSSDSDIDDIDGISCNKETAVESSPTKKRKLALEYDLSSDSDIECTFSDKKVCVQPSPIKKQKLHEISSGSDSEKHFESIKPWKKLLMKKISEKSDSEHETVEWHSRANKTPPKKSSKVSHTKSIKIMSPKRPKKSSPKKTLAKVVPTKPVSRGVQKAKTIQRSASNLRTNWAKLKANAANVKKAIQQKRLEKESNMACGIEKAKAQMLKRQQQAKQMETLAVNQSSSTLASRSDEILKKVSENRSKEVPLATSKLTGDDKLKEYIERKGNHKERSSLMIDMQPDKQLQRKSGKFPESNVSASSSKGTLMHGGVNKEPLPGEMMKYQPTIKDNPNKQEDETHNKKSSSRDKETSKSKSTDRSHKKSHSEKHSNDKKDREKSSSDKSKKSHDRILDDKHKSRDKHKEKDRTTREKDRDRKHRDKNSDRKHKGKDSDRKTKDIDKSKSDKDSKDKKTDTKASDTKSSMESTSMSSGNKSYDNSASVTGNIFDRISAEQPMDTNQVKASDKQALGSLLRQDTISATPTGGNTSMGPPNSNMLLSKTITQPTAMSDITKQTANGTHLSSSSTTNNKHMSSSSTSFPPKSTLLHQQTTMPPPMSFSKPPPQKRIPSFDSYVPEPDMEFQSTQAQFGGLEWNPIMQKIADLGSSQVVRDEGTSTKTGVGRHIHKNKTVARVDSKQEFDVHHFIARIICKWNPAWITESDKVKELPPVVDMKKVWPLLQTYNSFDDYHQLYSNLLLLEVWETILNEYKGSVRENKVVCEKMLIHSIKNITKHPDGHRTCDFELQGVIGRGKLTIRDSDLVKIAFRVTDENGKVEIKEKFAFVKAVSKVSRPKDGQINQALGTGGKIKRNELLLVVSVNVVVAQWQNKLVNVPYNVTVISSLVNAVREYSALIYLRNNKPLAREILKPVNVQTVFQTQAMSMKLHFQGRYNQSQQTAICAAAECATQPYALPRVFMLQGPPGTGKSSTIIGIIKQIVSSPQTMGAIKPRILLCAPSNAGIDELTRRLMKEKKEHRSGEKPISFVRVGKETAVHADVANYTLDNLVQINYRKHVENRAKPDSVSSEIREIDEKVALITASMAKCKVNKNESQIRKLEREIEKWNKRKTTLLVGVSNMDNTNADPITYEIRRKTEREILLHADVVCSTLSSCAGSTMKENLMGRPGEKHTPPFTCVIVDEAGQCKELETLIPLQYRITKLILVGDPEQLPATVISQKAAKMNYGQSLFERMYSHFQYKDGNPIRMLTVQYRMHSDICDFPNKHVYDGRLTTDPQTAEARKNFPHAPYRVLDVTYGSETTSAAGSVRNEDEAEIVTVLCRHLIQNKVQESHIGIITPYKNQQLLIRDVLKRKGFEGIECGTVDGFQGREKHVIVISCVRANTATGGIGFLADRRRMNVALTRAKYGLYIVGHLKSLRVNEDWRNLIDDAKQRNLIDKINSRMDASYVISKACRK